MDTKFNKTGRLIFNAGLLVWSLSLFAKTADFGLKNGFLSSMTFTILFYIGIIAEFVGFYIVSKTGGFKNKKFCNSKKS